jgi:hypothetical protein
VHIKTITVTYSRTFNLGNYNSARFEVTLGAELEEGDDPAEAEAQLWAQAKEGIKAQALPVVRPRDEEA